MSALAGIFKFDPRDCVDRNELEELARRIERMGPDGGSEHLAQNIGMAFRAFHTTPESHFETQPLVCHSSVLTWDGRLDNRDEILARVKRQFAPSTPDIDLVLRAYEEWGTACFRELVGDWALALWDANKHELYLARDYMGVRRLFYRRDETGVRWCSTIEPLVLNSQRRLHLDFRFLAGCLYPRPPVETTPYEEIRAVVPASFVTFGLGGWQVTEPYWCLNPSARIRYAADSEYESHFREIFQRSVARRLRADRTLIAELSGGVDSSAIVCMADEIRCGRTGVDVETLSYYDTEEASGDERPYFTLVEHKRGRAGHHVSLSKFNRQAGAESLKPLPDEYFVASPGYSADTVRWDSTIDQILHRCGSRVVLSGLGGDELLGGVQYEAPELAEHIVNASLILLLQSSLRWGLARKKTVYRLLADAFELLLARWDPSSHVTGSIRRLSWSLLSPITHDPALRSFSQWCRLSPPQLSMESVRYGLAQQLTAMDPPIVGVQEKRYPYLDRSLFSFLASIPRTQILQAGCRRHLVRRALRGIVPDQVLDRKTKWFGFRSSMTALSDQQNSFTAMFDDVWQTDGMIVDSALLQKRLRDVQHGAALDEAMALRAAVSIEQWLRNQIHHGIPALPGTEGIAEMSL